MAVDTQAVQIQIEVVDKNSAAAIGGVTKNLDSMGNAGASAGRQTELGMTRAAGAVREMGSHFQTNLDTVRLMRQELGLFMPRAMESMISRTPALMSAIKGISGAMIGLGAGMVVWSGLREGIRGAESLWHNVLNVNQAAEDYNAEVAKAKTQDFGNTHSIETTTLRIQEAKAAVIEYRREADASLHYAGGIWAMAGNLIPGAGTLAQTLANRSAAHDLMGQSYDAQRQVDELQKQRKPEQQHQANLDQIASKHLYDYRLSKERQITAEQQQRHDENAENARRTAELEGEQGNPVAKDSFWNTGKLPKQFVEDMKADASVSICAVNKKKS